MMLQWLAGKGITADAGTLMSLRTLQYFIRNLSALGDETL